MSQGSDVIRIGSLSEEEQLELNRLTTSEATKVALASLTACSSLLELMASDWRDSVRLEVAKNSATPKSVLGRLVHDQQVKVRDEAAKNLKKFPKSKPQESKGKLPQAGSHPNLKDLLAWERTELDLGGPSTRRLRLGLVGEFSAGKSTLVNSILGNEQWSTSHLPETKKLQIICSPGPHHRKRRPRVGSNDFVVMYSSAHLFELGVELWDTPGSNNTHKDFIVAMRALRRVDAALFLVDADDVQKKSASVYLKKVDQALEKRGMPPARVLVTKFDKMREDVDDEEELEEILEAAQENLGAARPLFTIDCRDLSLEMGPQFLRWLFQVAEEHYAKVGNG
jgi:small GTP-binding protein